MELKKVTVFLSIIFICSNSYSQMLFLQSKDSVNGEPRMEVGVGGWIKLSLIYDRMGIETTAALNPLYIPTGDVKPDPQFTGDMKQSRLMFMSKYRSDKLGELVGYIEGDFYGVGAAGFRLRHAYVKANKLLLGQYWSAFTIPWVWPNVADFDGPPTGIWKRMPQIRFTQKISDRCEFAISLETSHPEYTRVVDSLIVIDPKQNIPNFAGQFVKEWSNSKVALSGIYRNIRYMDTDSAFRYFTGYGLAFSFMHTFKNRDLAICQIAGGEGIASYMSSFGGMGFDVIVFQNGSKGLIPTWGGYVSYQHFWGDSEFSSNLLLGWAVFNNKWFKEYKDSFYGTSSSMNICWTPLENIVSFVELQYGTHTDIQGKKGAAFRIMLTAEYSF